MFILRTLFLMVWQDLSTIIKFKKIPQLDLKQRAHELGCTFEQDEVGIYIDQKNNIYSLQSSLITDKS